MGKKDVEQLHFYIHTRQHKALLKNVCSLYKSAKRINRETHGSNIYNQDFIVKQSSEFA